MKRDFQTREDIYVLSNGKMLDLHHNYKFFCLCYNAFSQQVSLTWKSLTSNESISIEFYEVTMMKAKEADNAYPRDEAKTTSFLGFLDSEDVDIMDGFLPDSGRSDVHFIVGFQDSSAIKIAAERACLRIG